MFERVSNLMGVGLRLYHPFIAIQLNGKTSILFYSVNSAMLANRISRMIEADDTEVSIATYTALSQKLFEIIGIENATKVISNIIQDSEITKTIVEAITNKVMIKPIEWTNKYKKAALSIWLANKLANTTSPAYKIKDTLSLRFSKAKKRFSEEQQKIFKEINVNFISIIMPHHDVLRTTIYNKIAHHINSNYNAVTLLAKNGLAILSRYDTITINLNNIMQEIYDNYSPITLSDKMCFVVPRDLYSKITNRNIEECEDVFNAFLSHDNIDKVLFKNMIKIKKSLLLKVISKFKYLYSKTKCQVCGTNTKNNICTLCTLEAAEKTIGLYFYGQHYNIQYALNTPAEFNLAYIISECAKLITNGFINEIDELELHQAIIEWNETVNKIVNAYEEIEKLNIRYLRKIINTSHNVVVQGSRIENSDDYKYKFVYYLPRVVRAIMFTGLIPVAMGNENVEETIITPKYNLLNYNIYKNKVNNTITLLAAEMLATIARENSYEKSFCDFVLKQLDTNYYWNAQEMLFNNKKYRNIARLYNVFNANKLAIYKL